MDAEQFKELCLFLGYLEDITVHKKKKKSRSGIIIGDLWLISSELYTRIDIFRDLLILHYVERDRYMYMRSPV